MHPIKKKTINKNSIQFTRPTSFAPCLCKVMCLFSFILWQYYNHLPYLLKTSVINISLTRIQLSCLTHFRCPCVFSPLNQLVTPNFAPVNRYCNENVCFFRNARNMNAFYHFTQLYAAAKFLLRKKNSFVLSPLFVGSKDSKLPQHTDFLSGTVTNLFVHCILPILSI